MCSSKCHYISSLTFSFVGTLLRFHWSWRLRTSSCKRCIRTSFWSLWRQRHVAARLRGKWPGNVLVFSCQSHIMPFSLSWFGPIVIMTFGCLPRRGTRWSCLCVAGLRNWWKRTRRVVVDGRFRIRTTRTWSHAQVDFVYWRFVIRFSFRVSAICPVTKNCPWVVWLIVRQPTDFKDQTASRSSKDKHKYNGNWQARDAGWLSYTKYTNNTRETIFLFWFLIFN